MKALRRILGQTQAEFATSLRVSLPLITAIECGQRELSDKLACKIMIARGARLGRWSVSRDRRGRMRTKFKPFLDGRVDKILLPDAEMSVLTALAFKSSLKKWTQLPNVYASETSNQGSRSEQKELSEITWYPRHSKSGKLSPETTLSYSKQFFEDYVRMFNAPDAAEKRFETLAPRLKALFVAAGKTVRGSKSRLPALELSLLAWMAEANSDFKLGIDLDGGTRVNPSLFMHSA